MSGPFLSGSTTVADPGMRVWFAVDGSAPNTTCSVGARQGGYFELSPTEARSFRVRISTEKAGVDEK